MILALFLCATLLGMLGPLISPIWRRTDPSIWVWEGFIIVILSAAFFEVGLGLFALPTVLSGVGLTSFSRSCQRVLEGIAPGQSWVGWLAFITSVSIPVGAAFRVRTVWKTLSSLRNNLDLFESVTHREREFLILPLAEPTALSISDHRCRILVSEGLVQMVDDGMLAAILAHEQAHLTHRHQRILFCLSAVEGGIPFLRWSTSLVRLGLERWADEVAANHVGRDRVAEALLRVIDLNLEPSCVPAFGVAQHLIQRVQALKSPVTPPAKALSLCSFALPRALELAGVGVLAWWGVVVYLLLFVPQPCPL